MGLGLAFEETFVASLAETCGGIHDELRVGRGRDTTVASEVEPMRRCPVRAGVVGADLQVNQGVLTTVMTSHCREGLPIDSLFINAEATPSRLVLEYLMSELVDA